MARPLLEVNGLSKRFCRNAKLGGIYAARDILNDVLRKGPNKQLRPGEFWAVRDASFQVRPGEVVGIIGHNGAGKSTLINLITGVLRPTVGSIDLSTRKVVTMSHHGGLDPVQTGRENIINQLSLNGMTKRSIAQNIEAVLSFAEIGQAVDAPVGTYSYGMKLRLLFAMYSQLSPDLFVIDEALNGGDLKFSRKFRSFLDEYIAKGGSILLASHDLFSVQTLCSSCILLDQGRVVTIGEPIDTIDQYQKMFTAEGDITSVLAEQAGQSSLFDELGLETPGADAPEVVQIESVRIEGIGGKALTPGDSAMVQIECTCRQAVSPVACTILIQAADASWLAMITTVQSELTEGRHIFSCLIDNLSLVPATYRMIVSFTDPDRGTVYGIKGYYDRAVQFEIIAPLDRLTTLNRFFHTYIHLPASWTSDLAH